MSVVVKQPIPDPPYSLHDAHILSLELEGFLNLPGRCLEFFLEVYYTGEIRYLLKD